MSEEAPTSEDVNNDDVTKEGDDVTKEGDDVTKEGDETVEEGPGDDPGSVKGSNGKIID